jgi:hypothetical protein
MQNVGSVVIDLPEGAGVNYPLTAQFSFGEAQITVRVIDEQTGNERHTRVIYDNREVTAADIYEALYEGVF